MTTFEIAFTHPSVGYQTAHVRGWNAAEASARLRLQFAPDTTLVIKWIGVARNVG